MKDKLPIKVIISAGPGRLHLIQSAVELKKVDVDVKVITGWIPGKMFSDSFVDWMGGWVGRKNNLAHALKKRNPAELERSELKSCGIAEFFIQFLFLLSKFKLISRNKSALIGWTAFGLQSKKYIKNADIFHVRGGAGAGGVFAYAKNKNMKVIVDYSIAHPNELSNQIEKSINKTGANFNKYISLHPKDTFWKMVLRSCDFADMLVVNSDYVKWSFIKEGYPEHKIKVVYWGVNSEFNIQKQIYYSTSQIRLIFTGAFGLRKGAGLIIAALTELKNRNIDFTFDIVGSVTGEISIPRWMQVSPNIVFHGHLSQDKMKSILLASDIYIFPTYTEGCAQSVKEAMSVGLPVITTRQSGVPIIHKVDGWLIDDDSIEALISAILELSNNPDLRQRIGSQAAKTIKLNHTWEIYAKNMKSVYYDLLNDE
ncbi:glycosyltransferase family 4 protein [Salmonirosea aquatica]|uniref:Glycosyltransferase n=1 Tax=Salmonirosea aquatica TaxID=2654236 RepID=A0A7C9BDI0_9BACT|nr:glycosyltransferase [Cytophagaceae bacterium SJW1-29]